MAKTPVLLVFDAGKTNKKLLLFDEAYRIVYEESMQFAETRDEDGDACEDVAALAAWVKERLAAICAMDEYDVLGVNISAYGASLVHVDSQGEVIAPLYNYLKPYPKALSSRFYAQYGGEDNVALQTASPVLGSLNAGMQLFRLKHTQPAVYEQVHFSLHLPQFLSFLVSGRACSDITSVGCHTQLWDFERNAYHAWVAAEGISRVLAPMVPADAVMPVRGYGHSFVVGPGLHDSSAALIPYLRSFDEPFILLSTGTWCISLNPFNHTPLTVHELQCDCLCYLNYQGTPVKASRLFAGFVHEEQVKRLASHYGTGDEHYRDVAWSPDLVRAVSTPEDLVQTIEGDANEIVFKSRDLAVYPTYEAAYHRLMLDIIRCQVTSTRLVMHNSETRRIFVDGGFSKNSVFMYALASALPEVEVYGASVAQATAIGAALAIHAHWNTRPVPADLISLQHYAVAHDLSL